LVGLAEGFVDTTTHVRETLDNAELSNGSSNSIVVGDLSEGDLMQDEIVGDVAAVLPGVEIELGVVNDVAEEKPEQESVVTGKELIVFVPVVVVDVVDSQVDSESEEEEEEVIKAKELDPEHYRLLYEEQQAVTNVLLEENKQLRGEKKVVRLHIF
jgi:hypothetical protein